MLSLVIPVLAALGGPWWWQEGTGSEQPERAQEADPRPDDQEPTAVERPSSGRHFGLVIGDTGISFGNRPRLNGLRFNFSDSQVEQINGFNFTLWKPGTNPASTIRGFSLGIVYPHASQLAGLQLGLGGVVAENSLSGLSLGLGAVVSNGTAHGLELGGLALVLEDDAAGLQLAGLASVAGGDLTGANLSGLATVADGRVTGLNLSGLATVSQGSMRGINLSGLATVSDGSMTGLNGAGLSQVCQGSMAGITVSGLATVANGPVSGIQLSGLSCVAEGTMMGLHAAGLALVGGRSVEGVTGSGLATIADQSMRWVNVSGLALQAGRSIEGLGLAGAAVNAGSVGIFDFAPPASDGSSITGLAGAAYRIQAAKIQGMTVASLVRARQFRGVSLGLVHLFEERQTGLTIGLFNSTQDLDGIQIGLLNHAPDGLFKLLPFFNFDFN